MYNGSTGLGMRVHTVSIIVIITTAPIQRNYNLWIKEDSSKRFFFVIDKESSFYILGPIITS